jgi:hypothetical protein
MLGAAARVATGAIFSSRVARRDQRVKSVEMNTRIFFVTLVCFVGLCESEPSGELRKTS